MGTKAPKLSVEGLTVAVPSVDGGVRSLVDNLDFALEPGERVALVGPSGSGKTTLLRCLAGLVDARAGQVRLDGQAPAELGWPRYRARVMWVPQRPVLFEETVVEDLRAPHRLAAHRGRAFDETRAQALLEAMGLGSPRAYDAARLSEGERQRVALARALLLAPDVLLVDEPTSALDPAATDAVEAELVAFAEEGGAMLVVTHDPAQAARLTTRTITLGGGAS